MSLLRRITLHGACLQTARASNVSLVAAMARCSTKPGIASSTNGDMKMARIVGIDLNRIKSEYARTTTPSQQKLALAEIGKTPLSKIQGLDVKLVAQLLSTLVSLDAPPGLDITEQCASWLCANAESATLTGNALAQSLHALKMLQFSGLSMVVDVVSGRIPASLEVMSPTSVVMILDALCETRSVESHGNQILAKVQEIVTDGADTDAVMLAGALARLPESEDSIFLVRLAVSKILAKTTEAHSPIKTMGDIAALIPVLSKIEAQQASVLQSAILATFKQLDNAIPLRDVVSLLRSAASVGGENPIRMQIVKCVSSLDLKALPDDKAVQIIFAFSRVAPLSPSFSSAAAAIALRDQAKLTHHLHQQLLLAMEGIGSVEPERNRLVSLLIEKLLKRAASSTTVEGQEIAAVLSPFTVEKHFQEIHALVMNNASSWKTHDVIIFLESASPIPTKFARKLMRDCGPLLSGVVGTSNSTQLSTIAACYGRARVRNDNLCEAISNRAVALASELSIQSLSVILTSLAVVDYRVNKAFLELASTVRTLLPRASATQVANLIGSFSKLMVWNYRLFASLSQRAFELCQDFTFPQIVTVVSGLNRMSLRHDEMFQELIGRVRGKSKQLTTVECVHLLSAFSNAGVWDVVVFDELASKLIEDQQSLDAKLIGESLMAFARVGLRSHRIFQDLSLRALAIGPSCPPISLANIATAYSLAGCRHEELFSVLAERVLQAKDDCPAVTIGAILAAFANVGLKNDRLFIEMIPRVRHVAQYGTPKDVASVVTAYATVGLWHYKLFVKLAERAVHLRGECRGVHIAQILAAYAKVEMKYEKLFAEFALRVQTIAHVLSVSEIISITQSYCAVGMCDNAVFFALGDRLTTLAGSLEEQEAQIALTIFTKANTPHTQLFQAIATKYPSLVREQKESSAAPTDDAPQHSIPSTPVETTAASN